MRCLQMSDGTGNALNSLVVTGTLAITMLLASPIQAGDETKSSTEKNAEYVETAKPTQDGTVHPNGDEVKPREQWLAPCPADKKIMPSGECVAVDKAPAPSEMGK